MLITQKLYVLPSTVLREAFDYGASRASKKPYEDEYDSRKMKDYENFLEIYGNQISVLHFECNLGNP
jgi:hypothetical protein